MKNIKLLFSILVLIISFISCKSSNDGPVLGLDKLSLSKDQIAGQKVGKIPESKLIKLANNTEKIKLQLDDVLVMFENIKNGKGYQTDHYNLFKTIVYRFYSRVDVKNKVLSVNVKAGEDIGIDENLFIELKKGLTSLNEDLKKENDRFKITDDDIRRNINDQLDTMFK